MRQARRLQWVWLACLASIVAVGVLCWWVQARGRPAAPRPSVRHAVMSLVIAATVADASLAVWLYRTRWRPPCEQALKLVWAGRLVNAAEARTIVQTLTARGIVIMSLWVSPALYGIILACLGTAQAGVIGALIGAGVVGLGVFYWQGLLAASDLFRHVERITRL